MDWVLNEMIACDQTPDKDTLLALHAAYSSRGEHDKVNEIQALLNLRQQADDAAQHRDMHRPRKFQKSGHVQRSVEAIVRKQEQTPRRAEALGGLSRVWNTAVDDSVTQLITALSATSQV